MKIGKLLITALLATGVVITTGVEAAAQNTSEAPLATQQSGGDAWYMSMDYDGLMFRIPAGSKVERGSTLTVIYPDGSYGLTMQTVDHPANRKISVELCNRLADSLGMPRSLVKKVKFSGVQGAKAQGVIDGKSVTCLVLPIDNHQVMITLMADPLRADWVRAFLDSLRR